ncbi:MAG: hypothetical protein ACI9DM_001581 [Cyclobacteriaceae bacterium]|jgi:hypothetical protein
MTHFQWMILTLIVTFFLEVGILYVVNYSCVNRIVSRAINIFYLHFFKRHSFLFVSNRSVKKYTLDANFWLSDSFSFQLLLSDNSRIALYA